MNLLLGWITLSRIKLKVNNIHKALWCANINHSNAMYLAGLSNMLSHHEISVPCTLQEMKDECNTCKKNALNLSQNAIRKSSNSGTKVRNQMHGRMIVLSKPTESTAHWHFSCVWGNSVFWILCSTAQVTVFVEHYSVTYVTTDVAKGTPGST